MFVTEFTKMKNPGLFMKTYKILNKEIFKMLQSTII